MSKSSKADKYKMIANEKITPLLFKSSLGSYGYLISYKAN